MDLDFLLKHSHGVVRTAQLQACDLSSPQIRAAVRTGSLTQVRRGWYATPDADSTVLRAVRTGGVLSCVSALRLHGYWTPQTPLLHTRRTEHGKYRATSTARDGVRECSYTPGNARPSASVDGALTALRCLPGCVSDEELVAVVDSMLHQRRVGIEDVHRALAGHPKRIHCLLERCDARAESGTESLVRQRLRRYRLKVTPQVVIPGVGRVDLVVGERLVIEVDSWQHHSDRGAYENDRYRDLVLHDLGYVVVRVTYHRVIHDWDSVERHILGIIASGGHRGRVLTY